MERRTLLVVILAGLAVLAIGLAASTLETYEEPEPGGDGEGGDAPFAIDPPTDEGPVDTFDGGWIIGVLFTVLLVVFGVALVLTVLNRDLQEVVTTVAILLLASAAVLLIVHFVEPEFPTVEPPDPGELSGDSERGTGDGGGGPDTDAVELPSALVQALAGLGLLVLIAGLVLGVRSSRIGADADEAAPAGDPDAAAIGRAAGRAADRLEAGDDATDETLENEVYRAWEEMVEPLDVGDPETTTPGEFATAAIDAGVSEPHVRELTRLFEDVRYGGKAPTESREERAIRCFRRIEADYDRGEE